MKRCGTCKHWSQDREDFRHGSPNDLAGICTRIDSGEEGRTIDKPSDVYTVDASDYYSAIICGSDFGCVMHEEKI